MDFDYDLFVLGRDLEACGPAACQPAMGRVSLSPNQCFLAVPVST